MGALIKILITLPFIAGLFWISFSNRGTVDLAWSPLHDPLTIPVAVLVLMAVTAGFFWGAMIVWINEAPTRRDRRRQRKEVAKLEKELTVARLSPTDRVNPASPVSTLLP